jgi:hypothetical protein
MAGRDQDIFSAMQDGEPIARYKKTILGRVHVTVLNEFSDEPEEKILMGNPEKQADLETSSIEVWTPKADSFFRKINRKHFDAGRIVKMKGEKAKVVREPSPNEITDEEIEELLNSPFLALKARLDKFTDEAPVFRLLNMSRELEKSEKLIKHIEQRLSELQLEPYRDEEEV